MKRKQITFILLCLATSLSLYSCKKATEPVLTVTLITPENDVRGGKTLQYDVTASGVNAITHFKAEAAYGAEAMKVLIDSSFGEQAKFTYTVNYDIPETAKKGDQITFNFSVTDKKGKTSSTSRTATVVGSKPQLSVTQSKTTAAVGDTVNFNVTASSPDGLKTFEVVSAGNKLHTENLSSNTFTTVYSYIVTQGDAGKNLGFNFNIFDQTGGSNLVSKDLKVQ